MSHTLHSPGLSDRQIERLYSMHRQGYSNKQIAEALQVNRNTVSKHICGHASIPSHLIRKLGIRRPLIEKEWLTMQEASPWLPFQPDPKRLHQAIKTGQLKAATIHNPHAGRGRVITVTTFPWMTEYALRRLPAGVVYATIFEVADYLGDHDLPYDRLPKLRRVRPHVTPLPALNAWASDLGISITFGPVVVRRALRCLDKIGVAVI